jgi:hypothetical protein
VITSNRKYPFGAQVSVVETKAFRCAVSTAPEGIFKGYSTVIMTFDGQWGNQKNKQTVAKAFLNARLSKAQRAEVHKTILDHLDAFGEKGVGLAETIDDIFENATRRKLIVDSMKSPLLMSSFKVADALAAVLQHEQAVLQDEGARLMAVVKKIADKIGEAPIVYNDHGEMYVHPELWDELRKPGNEALLDRLRDAKAAIGSKQSR